MNYFGFGFDFGFGFGSRFDFGFQSFWFRLKEGASQQFLLVLVFLAVLFDIFQVQHESKHKIIAIESKNLEIRSNFIGTEHRIQKKTQEYIIKGS